MLLSLPAWTPGAYELTFFARWVSNFTAHAGEGRCVWDKLDYDTWRVQPAGAKSVTVRFDYLADTLDNAMAWAKPDFVLFNGTNVFPYPEGRGTEFPATVDHQDRAGLAGRDGNDSRGRSGGGRTARRTITIWWTSRSSSGRIGLRQHAGGRTLDATGDLSRRRLARDAHARRRWDQIGKMIPAGERRSSARRRGRHYTVMLIFDSAYGGGSALEHTRLARRDLQPAASSAIRARLASPPTRSSTRGT